MTRFFEQIHVVGGRVSVRFSGKGQFSLYFHCKQGFCVLGASVFCRSGTARSCGDGVGNGVFLPAKKNVMNNGCAVWIAHLLRCLVW